MQSVCLLDKPTAAVFVACGTKGTKKGLRMHFLDAVPKSNMCQEAKEVMVIKVPSKRFKVCPKAKSSDHACGMSLEPFQRTRTGLLQKGRTYQIDSRTKVPHDGSQCDEPHKSHKGDGVMEDASSPLGACV